MVCPRCFVWLRGYVVLCGFGVELVTCVSVEVPNRNLRLIFALIYPNRSVDSPHICDQLSPIYLLPLGMTHFNWSWFLSNVYDHLRDIYLKCCDSVNQHLGVLYPLVFATFVLPRVREPRCHFGHSHSRPLPICDSLGLGSTRNFCGVWEIPMLFSCRSTGNAAIESRIRCSNR